MIKISDRAELVIKSNVEGLEVKVRQLAQPEQERTLTIGENSVRVRSGQVEVVLTGANADEYEVVGDKITLKRFGREIVEVKRRAVGQAFQPDPNASPTPNRNTAQSEGSSRSGQPRKADLREPSAWDDLDPARIPEAERVPRQPEGLVAVLGQHRRRVWNLIRSASVSADGSQYSLTTEDGLYLFDRVLKKPVRFFPGTSHGGIHSAAFLLDGRLAMFNPESHGIELQIFAKPRDNGPLEKQSAVTTNCKSGIFHPMASSDGRWLAAYEDIVEKANFSLWQLSDAAPQRAGQFVLPNPHGGISPGCFSPDGQWFCFTDNHNTQSAVHLIDLRVDTPREAVVLKAEADEKSDAPAKGFQHAVFFADGRLATADRNGRTWFWKLNDGEPRRVGSIPASGALLHAPTKSLRLVVNPTDRFHVWDLSVEPPKLLGTSSSSFPIDNIQNAAIAPDGETVFTAHLNGAVRFWSVTPNGVTELDPLAPNPKRYGALGQTKVVGNLLCASSETDRLSIWQPTRNGLEVIPNPTPLRRVFEKHAKQQLLIVDEIGSVGIQLLRLEASRWNPSRRLNAATVRSAALNDDGRRLAVGRYNGTEEILELWGWDSDDSPARKLTEVKAGTEYIMDLAFAEEGRTLVSRHGRQAVEIWNVQDDQFVPRAKLPPRVFDQFAIAPNGRTLATVEAFNLELWNLTSDLQQPTASFAIPGSGAVAFSPDGKRLAASFWENGASAGVQLINLATGVVEKRLTCPGQVDQLDFTDDSRHLITGNANGTIYVVRLP